MCRRCVSLLFAVLLVGFLTKSVPAQEPSAATESAAPPSATEPSAAPSESPPAPAASGDLSLPPAPGNNTGNLTLRETTARGIQLFQQGDYDGAIQWFTAAYVISPKPMFLFNIAQSHRKVGRTREALLNYQLFLRKAPDTPLRPETEAYIELVRTQLAASQQPQPSVRETRAVPPLYKRPWLWGTLGAVVALGAGVVVGVYFGTRPPSTTLGIIEPTF